MVNNRLYDSDIFVMSNTTFDEEMISLSSRRVSAGKHKYKNELRNFLDNSNEIKLQDVVTNEAEVKKIKGITNKLFVNQ